MRAPVVLPGASAAIAAHADAKNGWSLVELGGHAVSVGNADLGVTHSLAPLNNNPAGLPRFARKAFKTTGGLAFTTAFLHHQVGNDVVVNPARAGCSNGLNLIGFDAESGSPGGAHPAETGGIASSRPCTPLVNDTN